MTRETFLHYVSRRAALIADPGLDGIGHSDQATTTDLVDADHLVAVAEDFAAAVDAENATWQRASRVLAPLSYEDAVVIDGSAGRFVTHHDTYTRQRVSCEARVGEVDSVWSGRYLLGWA